MIRDATMMRLRADALLLTRQAAAATVPAVQEHYDDLRDDARLLYRIAARLREDPGFASFVRIQLDERAEPACCSDPVRRAECCPDPAPEDQATEPEPDEPCHDGTDEPVNCACHLRAPCGACERAEECATCGAIYYPHDEDGPLGYEPDIHDVMSGEEIAEYERDAEFALDAADEERWAEEAAADDAAGDDARDEDEDPRAWDDDSEEWGY